MQSIVQLYLTLLKGKVQLYPTKKIQLYLDPILYSDTTLMVRS